jgi:hypothetical protein
MIRTFCATSVAALALAAGANAAVMQLDINGIQVRAGGPFDGVTHTGTLTITKAATGTLLDILVDGASQGGAVLSDFSGEIELFNGNVVGGFLSIFDGDGDRYDAAIGQAGRVNTQAGRGFRIDGLTFAGVFSGPVQEDASFFDFGGVDVSAIFGADAFNETLEGSFLLTSFSPDANGIDTRADIDVFIVPTPGTAALAGLAGIAILRRKR